jgi:hypothetical protein
LHLLLNCPIPDKTTTGSTITGTECYEFAPKLVVGGGIYHREHNILKMEDCGTCSREEARADENNLGNNDESRSHDDILPGFKTFEEFRQVV